MGTVRDSAVDRIESAVADLESARDQLVNEEATDIWGVLKNLAEARHQIEIAENLLRDVSRIALDRALGQTVNEARQP